MKLTAQQIDQLFTFTRQHYVEWYDLQSELVDHLANAIESQWLENPKLTFDEALNAEFKKFGVFGFMDVVEKRQAVLDKKYNGLVWHHFKDFFGIPKIVLTLAMTFVLFTVIKLSDFKEWIFMGLFVALVVFSFYAMISNKKQRKKISKANQKKWLFEEIINHYGNLSVIATVPFNIMLQLLNNVPDLFTNNYWTVGMSFFLVLLSIAVFIIFKIIPRRTSEYLETTYPEYKLVNL
ncbi:hypothetical protein [Flavobacterium hiemivividum]|uniref:Uncharacterized protein n=1 Tax=Flavobacterium hiemivividum TaxID=2541734 RepID=A0A4R5D668_9FLAO|nr:hypothetical protein [Flavobacterium hiemivividum]TDE06774.1 hypothetical protein E0F98_03930 [Flavobacterium hiemivividum]